MLWKKQIRTAILTVLALGLMTLQCAAAGAADRDMMKALSQAQIFSGLTRSQLAALKPCANILNGKAGEQLIQQGSVMGRILIVLGGKADIRINGKSYLVMSGQILLGEIEFLDGRPASADVVLLTDADYIELNTAELNIILAAHPDIGYTVMREIARIEAQRLRKASGG